MEIVGQINFDDYSFNVYNSLDEPYFMIEDVLKFVSFKAKHLIFGMLENDEIISDNFITELGLYNVLSQTDREIGRKWRRIVHSNLIMMRRNNKLTIEGQFEEWDAMLDDLYIDPETGILMQSVTVAGGDVEQVPYED